MHPWNIIFVIHSISFEYLLTITIDVKLYCSIIINWSAAEWKEKSSLIIGSFRRNTLSGDGLRQTTSIDWFLYYISTVNTMIFERVWTKAQCVFIRYIEGIFDIDRNLYNLKYISSRENPLWSTPSCLETQSYNTNRWADLLRIEWSKQ